MRLDNMIMAGRGTYFFEECRYRYKAKVILLLCLMFPFVNLSECPGFGFAHAFSEVFRQQKWTGTHNSRGQLDLVLKPTCFDSSLRKRQEYFFSNQFSSSNKVCFAFLKQRISRKTNELHAERYMSESGSTKREDVFILDKYTKSGKSRSRSNRRVPRAGNQQEIASKEIEQDILRLGRQGKTDEALEVYYSLWTEPNLSEIEKSNGLSSKDRRNPSEKFDVVKVNPKTRHMNMALDACARAQPARLSEALNIFHNGLQRGLTPNVYTFGSLMHTCARSVGSDPRSRPNPSVVEREDFVVSNALRMLGDMSSKYHVIPNQVIWSTALLACRHRPYTALGLLRFAQEYNQISFNAVAYNTLLSAFANRVSSENDPDTLSIAESLVKEMETGQKFVRVDMISLSRFSPEDIQKNSQTPQPLKDQPTISKLQSLDSSKVTLMTIDELKESAEHDSRDPLIPQPDSISYATLMSAYERQSKWRNILRVAREMEEKGRHLDGLALNTALNACRKLGLADEALHFLRAMKSIGRIKEQEEIESGTWTKRSRITRGRERKGAKQDMEGPDAVAYGLAIEACARAGRWKEGLNILNDMKRTLSQTEGWTKNRNAAVPYTAAIDGCAEAGEWKTAIKILHDMIHLDQVIPTVYTYSAVIHACAIAAGSTNPGDEEGSHSLPMEAALSVLRQMKSGTSHGATKDDATIVSNPDSVEHLIDNLSPPNHAHVRPNIVTYNSALQACAEGLSLTHAFQIMEEIRKDNIEPTIITFGSLMTACERVGSVPAMEKAFKYMEEHYPNLTDHSNEVIFGAALSCCRKAKEPKKAYQIFQRMLRSQIKPNAATCNTALATLIECMNRNDIPWTRQELLDRSILIFKAMEGSPRYTSEKPNSTSYALLIRGHVQNNQPAEAENVLRKLKGRFPQYRPRVELYTSIVTSYERAKRPLKALELMEEMRAEGYDFYNLHMLDSAFKRLLKLTNQLAQGGSSSK